METAPAPPNNSNGGPGVPIHLRNAILAHVFRASSHKKKLIPAGPDGGPCPHSRSYHCNESHVLALFLNQHRAIKKRMGLLLVLTAVVKLIVIPLISKTNCCISSVFLSLSVTRGQPARLWPHPLALLRVHRCTHPQLVHTAEIVRRKHLLLLSLQRNVGWMVMASFQTCWQARLVQNATAFGKRVALCSLNVATLCEKRALSARPLPHPLTSSCSQNCPGGGNQRLRHHSRCHRKCTENTSQR